MEWVVIDSEEIIRVLIAGILGGSILRITYKIVERGNKIDLEKQKKKLEDNHYILRYEDKRNSKRYTSSFKRG